MAISPYIQTLRQKIGNDFLLLPSVGAVIFDDRGQILLQQARDDGLWYVPGGAVDPGEEPADAIVREMIEETGLAVEPKRIIDVVTSPPITYPNGHQVQYVAITFLCIVTGGHLRVADDESIDLCYFAVDALPELRPDHQARIQHALSGATAAAFQLAGEWRGG